MALGSTQPLTGMSARGKDGRCVGLTTLPPTCANHLKIRGPSPPEALGAYVSLYRDSFTFTIFSI